MGSVLMSYTTSKNSDASLVVGPGTTLTTYKQTGGQGSLQCAATTVTAEAGKLLIAGEGAITTLNADGGEVTPISIGTITTCNVKGGTCDFTASAAARTVTNLKVTKDATLKINTNIVTVTNNIEAFEAGDFQYRVTAV